MSFLKEVVLVDKDLWREIIRALEGAKLCDHDEIMPLLEKIEKAEEENG